MSTGEVLADRVGLIVWLDELYENANVIHAIDNSITFNQTVVVREKDFFSLRENVNKLVGGYLEQTLASPRKETYFR